MMQHITNWAKGIWSRLTLSRQTNAEFPESQPDQTRRMILAGGTALVLTGLLVPGLTTEAEAHSYRGSRRRRHHWRRSQRRRHHWRRSQRRRHHWRRSRRHHWRRSRRRGWY
jgi:hypothetical protein